MSEIRRRWNLARFKLAFKCVFVTGYPIISAMMFVVAYYEVKMVLMLLAGFLTVISWIIVSKKLCDK